MRRLLYVFIALATVLLVVSGAIYGVRAWRSRTNRPAATVTGTVSASPARGDVTIDPRRQQLIGVRTVPVTRAAVDHTLRAVGIVRYDETRQADVNVKVEGWIRDLAGDYTGQSIRAGQPLFTLYSPELLTTENEFLLALKSRDQLQQSMLSDARERAEGLVASARQRLLSWDLSEEQVAALEKSRQASTALVFRAPVNGVVIDKQAVKGLHVMPGQSLYKVADLGTVWVEADVYENELADVRVGASAIVTVNAYPGERFSGRVIYIYPYLDEKTRTNKVRFELPNRGGRLKPGMFANVELHVRGAIGLIVPANAVLDSGTDQIVFVAQGEGRFEPRAVKVGRRLTDAIEIRDGLKDDEQVATGATFFLDSESQLRASLQSYEGTSPPRTASGDSAAPLDITLRTVPDPANGGSENQFEAVVKDASGSPIDDADVRVQLLMPAMPTMNMPAMRSEVKLAGAGGGVYRGTGQVVMAGRWDAILTVTRGGQRLGSHRQPLVAR